MRATGVVTMSNDCREFFDGRGKTIELNDIVWFDPNYVDVDSSPVLKEPFIVVGKSKSNYDILLVPQNDHSNLHRTEMVSVTHEDPYSHEEA